MSELNAVMGLSVLPFMNEILNKRKDNFEVYQKSLNPNFEYIKMREGTNYSYFPIIFSSEKVLIRVKKELESNNIFPRRYFYPSLNKLVYVEHVNPCIQSERISNSIMCLPNYYELTNKEILRISNLINMTVLKRLLCNLIFYLISVIFN